MLSSEAAWVNTIKTLTVERSKTARAALIWDGTNELGENVTNGYYSVTFTNLGKGKRTPLAEGFSPRDVGGAGHDLADCPLIKDHIKDHLIILDLAVFPSLAVAMEYAQFIETRLDYRSIAFNDAPSVMIVDGPSASLNSNGTPTRE